MHRTVRHPLAAALVAALLGLPGLRLPLRVTADGAYEPPPVLLAILPGLARRRRRRRSAVAPLLRRRRARRRPARALRIPSRPHLRPRLRLRDSYARGP